MSGCGTLNTYFQYDHYKKCLNDCETIKDESFKQQCKSGCYKNFDWRESPLLPFSEVKPQRKVFDKLQNKIDQPCLPNCEQDS